MATRTVSCIEVTCDRCGECAGEGFGFGAQHFPGDLTPDALVTVLEDIDWEVTDTGEHYCWTCKADRGCEAAGGHDWGPWTHPGFRVCLLGCNRVETRGIENVELPADPNIPSDSEAVHP